MKTCVKMIALTFLLFFVSAPFISCDKNKSKKLEGMITHIPVYAKAKYEWKGDGMIIFGKTKLHSRCWFLKASDPKEKVIEFYKNALPDADAETEPGGKYDLKEGEANFHYTIAGGHEDEYVDVTVKQEEFTICEVVLYSKKKLR